MSDSNPPTILIVDDESFNLDLLEQELDCLGYRTQTAGDGEAALRSVRAEKPNLILLDIVMPKIDGFEVCRRLQADDGTRDIPVIFMTALSDVEDKVKAFAAGGVDYVTKPFQSEELMSRVRAHLELQQARRNMAEQNEHLRQEIDAHHRARQTIEYLREEIKTDHNFAKIVGESPALKEVFDKIVRVAATDTTVLIQGETGTGKELLARAIHDRSDRNRQTLVKVNCAALPHELIESELFGHEKGAFTGATQQRKGRFELADKGTIFLDEVSELTRAAQAKLLRVLQEQEFERVGGTGSIQVDVRVVAATNKDLAAEVESGAFRQDLLYRLNVFVIEVPPLRDRRSDIPLLAAHFLVKVSVDIGREFTEISPKLLEEFQCYAWPGNVRELQNIIERSAILSRGPVLELEESLNSKTLPTDLGRTLEEVERGYIRQVLDDVDWIIEGNAGAAAILGLKPSTLRNRMAKLGIKKN
ncbi:sigma-54 dependent transcriptional regulator [Gammaproteobacteria bacterium]|nr:sigma-54 dependent transcriptional regulator [Gammaproteobacteria bacterium]